MNAAIALRRFGVTTATETIAAAVNATPLGLSALRAFAEPGSAPASLEPTLQRLADSPRRLLHDGTNDGTPHDDDILADLARDLLTRLA